MKQHLQLEGEFKKYEGICHFELRVIRLYISRYSYMLIYYMKLFSDVMNHVHIYRVVSAIITKTRLFKYIENFTSKKLKISR